MLGPVGARTSGIPLDRRKPYYTELFACLATRAHGATNDEVATAFDITPGRVRTDINKLRDWLGADPATGKRFLPDALDSRAAAAGGKGVYRVVEPLVDVDLFRRLAVTSPRYWFGSPTNWMASLEVTVSSTAISSCELYTPAEGRPGGRLAPERALE